MSKMSAWEQIKLQINLEKTVELQLAINVFEAASSTGEGYYSEDNHLDELEQLFVQPDLKWTGASTEFHNLAVAFSKADRNRSACNVLLKGLVLYPASVDLLADFLKYGTIDGRWDDCDNYYAILKSLGKDSWNWRAYSFSLDYMLEKREKTIDSTERKALQNDAIRLAKSFVEKCPTDLAYFDLSNVYRILNRINKEKATLEEAILKVKVPARCSLRLADIAINNGDYSLALERLKICKQALKPQPDINPSYVYVLNVLCKSSLIISKMIDNNGVLENCEEEVLAIYKDYNSAMAIGLDGVMKDTLQKVVAVIENQTGIKNSKGQIDAIGF